MGKINIGRWIVCGAIAGIVVDLLGTLIDGWMLGARWAAGMRELGHPPFTATQILWFNVVGLLVGLAAIWIYVGIRPRFGAGPRTAVYAALAVWVVGYLAPDAGFMVIPHLFSHHLAVYTTLGAMVEVVAGTLVGAGLYKEA
jgi:hypothetical protein